jgi:lipoate-protein ligase A
MLKTVHSPLTVPEGLEMDAEAITRGELHVQVARCRSEALSIGVSQSMDAKEVRRAKDFGIPVYRRSTGGMTLLHEPGDIFWSIVLPREPRWVGKDFVRRYSHFGAGWVDFLGRRNVKASWLKSPDYYPSYCLFSGRGEVLSIGGKALGGASQYLTSRALLHHGTVLNSVDPTRLESVFGMPSSMSRSHLTSLAAEGVNLSDGDLSELTACIERGVTEEGPNSRFIPSSSTSYTGTR